MNDEDKRKKAIEDIREGGYKYADGYCSDGFADWEIEITKENVYEEIVEGASTHGIWEDFLEDGESERMVYLDWFDNYIDDYFFEGILRRVEECFQERYIYFNNCRCRDHAGLFGKTAFYDLNTFGLQASMAADIVCGQKCIVASYDDNGDVTFDWYDFKKETLETDPGNRKLKVRVFRGKKLRSETMSKRKAARTKPYSHFFNKNGEFKRLSVIR